MTAFVKMHGLGNDFVVFDARDAAVNLNAMQAKEYGLVDEVLSNASKAKTATTA